MPKLQSLASYAVVVLLALYICCVTHPVNDTWWQLRIGDDIRLHHAIPVYDTYSWSEYHRPITLHEWGACLVFAEAYRHFDKWLGVWLVLTLTTISTLLALFQITLKRQGVGSQLVALMLVLLAGRLCGGFFTPRPQIFTYLCLTLSLTIFFRLRLNGQRLGPSLALLFGVQVIWANMHAASITFFLFCLIYLLGDAVQYLLTKETRLTDLQPLLRQVLIPLSCAAVTICALVVNPNGFAIYHAIFETVSNRQLSALISEWQPVNFGDPKQKIAEGYFAVVVIVIGATRLKRNPGDMLALIYLTAAALYATRNIPILAIGGTIIIAPYCPSALLAIKAYFYKSRTHVNVDRRIELLITGVIICAFAFVLPGEIYADGFRTEPSMWATGAEGVFLVASEPEDACAFIDQEGIPSSYRMYNNYDTGSYLIWRLRQHPVFDSTETFVYFGPVLETYGNMEKLPLSWRTLLSPYDPDFVVTDTDDKEAKLFLYAPDWALVYADGIPGVNPNRPVNLIFIKRTGLSAALIDKCRRDCSMTKEFSSRTFASAK